MRPSLPTTADGAKTKAPLSVPGEGDRFRRLQPKARKEASATSAQTRLEGAFEGDKECER
jgi:hypothetical protein